MWRVWFFFFGLVLCQDFYGVGKKTFRESEQWSFPLSNSKHKGVIFKDIIKISKDENFESHHGLVSFYGTKMLDVTGFNDEGNYHLEYTNGENFVYAHGQKTHENQIFYLKIQKSGGIYQHSTKVEVNIIKKIGKIFFCKISIN